MTQAANTYAQALYDLAKDEGLGKTILEELSVLKAVFADTPQYSKLLSDIPEVDVVITMGCNVQCPFLPCSHREDWGLDDPSGKSDEAFLETIRLIEEKVLDLRKRME